MMDELAAGWAQDVTKEYLRGTISSERGLQAVLFASIRQRLPDLETYIEPGLRYYPKGGPKYIPDLVLCDANSILLIGEIKYAAHYYPEIWDDAQKLLAMDNERSEGHPMRADPVTGSWEQAEGHWLNADTRYALFFVGRHDCKTVHRETLNLGSAQSLAERITLFYGRIDPNGKPEFGVA